MSEFDCGWVQDGDWDDDGIDEMIREAYARVNKDYLREQAIIALIASGKDRKEAEEWLMQADVALAALPLTNQ